MRAKCSIKSISKEFMRYKLMSYEINNKLAQFLSNLICWIKLC